MKKIIVLMCALALSGPANIQAAQQKNRTAWVMPTLAAVASVAGISMLYNHRKMHNLQKEEAKLERAKQSRPVSMPSSQNNEDYNESGKYGELIQRFRMFDRAAAEAQEQYLAPYTAFLKDSRLKTQLHEKAEKIYQHCEAKGCNRCGFTCATAAQLAREAVALIQPRIDEISDRSRQRDAQRYAPKDAEEDKLADTRKKIGKYHTTRAIMSVVLGVSVLTAVPFAIAKLKANKGRNQTLSRSK